MSVHHTTTANPSFRVSTDAILQNLSAIAAKYPGRALFCTRFSPEDQVVTQLIFKHKLPIRVFTYSGGDQYDILVRSVDFFGSAIEVSYHQARLNAAAFAAQHPAVVRSYEDNPATAPLVQILQGHHLLISSRQKAHLAAKQTDPVSLEWDEANQRAIFYPLFDWTTEQVQSYLDYFNIPSLPTPPAPAQAPLVAPADIPSIWHNALKLIAPKRRESPFLKKRTSLAGLFNRQSGIQPIFGLME